MHPNRRGSTRNLGLCLCALLLVFAVEGAAVRIRYGLGTPQLKDWCRLDWDVVCAYGVMAWEERGGLLLYSAPRPPGTGFQIPVAEVPSRALLFLLESPRGGGRVQVSSGEGEWESISIPQAGNWWLLVEGIASSEEFRFELGPYTDVLAVRSVYYRCGPIPYPVSPKWECLEEFLGGMVIGVIVTWLLVWVGQSR